MEKKVTIDAELSGSERLDSFILKNFPEYSRSYFQKLILSKSVLVNGKAVGKSYLVKTGDRIEVSFPPEKALKGVPRDVPFEIVAMQKDFIIINKPAGLVVHRGEVELDDPTLVDGLLYRFKEFEEFDETERPGIVHRLDKKTSGLIIVARNIKAQIALSALFKERLVKKQYLAVVEGHPEKSGKIDFPIGRHRSEKTKMSHVSYQGRPALTYYQVLQYYKDCTLVSVRIVTGRTHQIRVHFAAIGHRLLGDPKYGIKSKLIDRQALHSWKMSFEYKENKYSYYVLVPDDFRQLLVDLKDRIVA